jgi:hypothetical protein
MRNRIPGVSSPANFVQDELYNGSMISFRFTDSADNDEGQLVFDNFSLLDNSVRCSKLLFTAAYHAAHAEGSAVFAFVCLLGSCLIVFTIMIHLNRNYKTWAKFRVRFGECYPL